VGLTRQNQESVMSWKNILGVAALGFVSATLYVQHREIAAINQELAWTRFGSDISRRATAEREFLNSLSPQEALMWDLLRKEAKESPEATAFAEYAESQTGSSIPIVARFAVNMGGMTTAVVGIHVYGQNDPKGYVVPTLAFYRGNRQGTARLARLDASEGEVYIGGEWKALHNGTSWELFREELKKEIEQHLHLTSY
jgi:hypothetical protein